MENVPTVPLNDDQHFLLRLVMGAYFAPDLTGEAAPKSPLQRCAEGLPNYNPSDLTGSRVRIAMMECVYYFLLRNCKPSAVVKQPCLLQYIHGDHPVSIDEGSVKYPSFDNLFPLELHSRSQDTIGNIIFVKKPNTDYMEARDVERFKRLTGLKDFVFDRDSVMLHVLEDFYNVKVGETCNTVTTPLKDSNNSHNNNNINNDDDVVVDDDDDDVHDDDDIHHHPSGVTETGFGVECLDKGQGMIFVQSCPSDEEWGNMIAAVKFGFGVTGSAARGLVRPALGLTDVGESEDSYLFQVSLPGVKRDERDFSCEVESDGTVFIKGVTVTGERIVEKCLQTFKMQTQNMCPPGPFSISFKLPGRVDPQRFHGTFTTDGIFEGVAFKERACSTS